MKIQYCSDLHLEFPENRKFLTKNPLCPGGDILILAGDIVPFAELEKAQQFIDVVSDNYSAIFWVPGNHEYYRSDVNDKPSPLFEKIRDNFHLVNNRSVDYGGVRIILSTLWARIDPQNEWDIQRGMADFSAISFGDTKLSPRQFNLLHEQSVTYLERELNDGGGMPTIVVTHHVPTLLNYPTMYRGSVLTQAFATEMFYFIRNSEAAFWMYGHHHANVPEFVIGKTKMITNQLGYITHREHGSFRRNAVIEI
jgi:predicted phosphohydrolase